MVKNLDHANSFSKLDSQIDSLSHEFLELSKKKPDEPLNKFKLRRVNQLLEQANTYLDLTDRPFADFSVFPDDELPTNSDVRVMLSQYRVCLSKFKHANTTYRDGLGNCWIIDGELSEVMA